MLLNAGMSPRVPKSGRVMAVKRDWSTPLARPIRAPDGTTFHTLRDAADFVVEQDELTLHWRLAGQALMVASLLPNAVEEATAAVERALEAEQGQK